MNFADFAIGKRSALSTQATSKSERQEFHFPRALERASHHLFIDIMSAFCLKLENR
jgi:hypothetical protein